MQQICNICIKQKQDCNKFLRYYVQQFNLTEETEQQGLDLLRRSRIVLGN